MSLIFTAIVPHPPMLIPAVGKEHAGKAAATKAALERIESDLYSSKPDLIIVISPHGELNSKAFTINLSREFTIDFETFGDFETKMTLPGDNVMFSVAKESIAAKSPINIISSPKLDHGVGVPMYFLSKHLLQTPIVPMYFSMLDLQAHFDFGKALKDVILNSDKRIAVIASGDLSHALSKDAPAGFHPDGKIFDEKVIKILNEQNCDQLINLDDKLIENAAECGLRSLLILGGIICGISCNMEIISYESPFGVGYLTAECRPS